MATRTGVWTFSKCTGLVPRSLGVTRAKGPAHTSLGQRPGNAPGQGPPKTTPSANGAAQFHNSLSAGRSFHIASANLSAAFPRSAPALAAKAWDQIPRAL